MTFLTRKKLPSQVPVIRIRIPPPSGKPCKRGSKREKPVLGRPSLPRMCADRQREGELRAPAWTARGAHLPWGSGGGQARAGARSAWLPIPPGWMDEGQQVCKLALFNHWVSLSPHYSVVPPPPLFDTRAQGVGFVRKPPTGLGWVTVTGRDAHGERIGLRGARAKALSLCANAAWAGTSFSEKFQGSSDPAPASPLHFLAGKLCAERSGGGRREEPDWPPSRFLLGRLPLASCRPRNVSAAL